MLSSKMHHLTIKIIINRAINHFSKMILFLSIVAIFLLYFLSKCAAKPSLSANSIKTPTYHSGYIVLLNNEIYEIANYIHSNYYELRKLHEYKKTFFRTADKNDYIIADEKSFCLKTKDPYSDFMDIKWVPGEEAKYNARQIYVSPELLLDI